MKTPLKPLVVSDVNGERAFGTAPENTFRALLRIHRLTIDLIEAAGGAMAKHAPGCDCAAGIDGIRKQLAELESTIGACQDAFLEEWGQTAQAFLDTAYNRAQRDLDKIVAGKVDDPDVAPIDQSKKLVH